LEHVILVRVFRGGKVKRLLAYKCLNLKNLAYLCKINITFNRYCKNPVMKNKLLAGFALLIMAISVCSCATSRKYGCPTVSVQTKKFKV